jgi:methenyltetrahydromethanopterin cyclohydrolase
LQALLTSQIVGLSTSQIVSLTTSNLNASAYSQVNALTTAQAVALTSTQLNAMALSVPPYQNMSTTDQLALATSPLLSFIQVDSIAGDINN